MSNSPSRTGLDRGKFVVLKRPESGVSVFATSEQSQYNPPLAWDEVFVLKRGDVLASAALRSYVQNALLMLDVDKSMKRDGRSGILSALEAEHLERLADDVTWLADQWEGHNHGKLPD